MTPSKGGVPPSGPPVYKHLARALHMDGRVFAFHDVGESNTLHIASIDGVPQEGWTVHSTVTLHLHRNEIDGTNIPVELMLVGPSNLESLANAVATAGFNVSKDSWLAAPGVVFPHLVSEYVEGTTTPHVMWIEPFIASGLSTAEIVGAGTVHWLQGMPITDAEYALLRRDGFDVLEELFGVRETPYFDLFRDSEVADI